MAAAEAKRTRWPGERFQGSSKNRVKKLSTLHSTPVHANPLGGQKSQSVGKLSAPIQVSFLKETPILRYRIASIPLPGYLNKSIFAGEAWCFEFI
jgi:hypothetical protein